MKRAAAAAHAKHAMRCTCGRVVHGNGAKWQHREMHRRRADGHHYTVLAPTPGANP